MGIFSAIFGSGEDAAQRYTDATNWAASVAMDAVDKVVGEGREFTDGELLEIELSRACADDAASDAQAASGSFWRMFG